MRWPALAALAALAPLVLFAACGTSDGNGTVVGTVHGQAFTIKDAISAKVYVQGSTTEQVAQVMLGNDGDLCTDASADSQIKGYIGVSLTVFEASMTSIDPAAAAGDYAIGAASGNAASWNAVVTDDMCQDVVASEASAISGTITVKSISGNTFSGTYDVTLDSGDQVTGKFAPVPCAGMENFVDATVPPTCK